MSFFGRLLGRGAAPDITGRPFWPRQAYGKSDGQCFAETSRSSPSGIYVLDGAITPWGDYGDILVNGMSEHLGDCQGRIQLERTGPFVPPITMPGTKDIVVTTLFKEDLMLSGLTGFTFTAADKARIVGLEWERWNRFTADPPVFPNSGEPEDYILERQHSPTVSEAIGELWEMCIDTCAQIDRVPNPSNPYGWDDIYLLRSSLDGRDWFRAEGVGYTYITQHTRDWLSNSVPDWFSTRPALVK